MRMVDRKHVDTFCVSDVMFCVMNQFYIFDRNLFLRLHTSYVPWHVQIRTMLLQLDDASCNIFT